MRLSTELTLLTFGLDVGKETEPGIFSSLSLTLQDIAYFNIFVNFLGNNRFWCLTYKWEQSDAYPLFGDHKFRLVAGLKFKLKQGYWGLILELAW